MSNSSFAAELTIGRSIRTAMARNRTKTALCFKDRSFTYSELVSRMNRAGNFAVGLGLGAGDVVALVAPNCIEYIEVVAGLSDHGIIVATLNPRLTSPELEDILDDCGAKAIIVHPSSADLVTAERRARVPVHTLGEEWEAILAAADDGFGYPAVSEDATFSISYTSGTTGRPKGVMLSHRGRAVAFLMMQAEYGCFGYSDKFLALSPQYHGAGFAFGAAPLTYGGTTVIVDHYDPMAMLDALADGGYTGIFLVPTHFHKLFALPEEVLARYRGRHTLKTIISNASALPQATKELIIAFFGEGLLNESYGSTEAGFVLNIRPEDHLRKPHCVGVPFVGMEIELRDEEGNPVPDNTPGELYTRGPTTFNGYWGRPAETAEAVSADGWVTVGDMAVRDEDGYFYIVDRKKDMIVSGGVNVYPREIENVIAHLPGVAEVAVVGLPDAEWGEKVCAFIVPAGGATVDAEAVIAACRKRLAGFKIPRIVRTIDELPRNPTGKILKRELRDMQVAD